MRIEFSSRPTVRTITRTAHPRRAVHWISATESVARIVDGVLGWVGINFDAVSCTCCAVIDIMPQWGLIFAPMATAPQAGGRILGHYRIEKKLGSGAMGDVYLAFDENLRRRVALKFPSRALIDDTSHANLLHEARITSALNHPHICTIYDVGELDGQSCIAMEYIEGHPLDEKIPRTGLPPESIVHYGVQIADALEYAHEHGVIHRDLKSSNIVVNDDGCAKVLDFGLAVRHLGAGSLDAGTRSSAYSSNLAGTLQYMAPELFSGSQPDGRTDIWALGVILYEMASGALPFHGTTPFELSSAIQRDEPAPISARLPAVIRTVVGRCLAKDPTQRYQHAGEIRAALEVIEANRVNDTPMVSGSKRGVALTRWRLLAGMVMLAGALILLVALRLSAPSRMKIAPGHITSVAVLPLANLSNDPEQDYFADGMTDVLITDLARVRALKRVTSRNSVMRYKSSGKPLRQIAHDLSVDALVTGAVMRAGNRIRITAQLIDPGTEKHLWANKYEGDLTEVLTLQGDVARAIANEINVELTPSEQASLGKVEHVKPEAYNAYLKGRYYWNKRDPEAVKKGYEYFQQAINADPSYAPAYSGVADSYIVLANLSIIEPAIAIPKIRAASAQAMKLDNTLAEPHASLAFAMLMDTVDWEGAKRELEIALRLSPNYATAHQWYAIALANAGEAQKALDEAKRAVELDPVSPIINTYLGSSYYLLRDYDRAVEQYRRTIDLDPDFAVPHKNLGLAEVAKGRPREAELEVRKALELSRGNPHTLAALGYVYAKAGRKDDALRIADELTHNTPHAYVQAGDMAEIYAALNDKDRAFEWLHRAAEDHTLWAVALTNNPAFDSLRDDTRFRLILRRLHLPPG